MENNILHIGKIIKKPIINPLTFAEEQAYTFIHCRYTTSPVYDSGWWVNIGSMSFIQNKISGEKLNMVMAINIPYAPQKHYLKNLGDTLSFILVFPQIPKDWLVFNFIEDSSKNSFKSYGITRNDIGIYRIEFN